MKKLFYLLPILSILMASCESGPKTYTYNGISFTLPKGYEVTDVHEDDDYEAYVFLIEEKKNDLNFMILTIAAMEDGSCESMTTDEIIQFEQDRAYGELDDLMDQEDFSFVTEPTQDVFYLNDGKDPFFVVFYEGRDSSGEFIGRVISFTMADIDATATIYGETQEDVDKLIDCYSSLRIQP